ncbi:phosphonate C-P lyase system protein PhnG [Ramlibacter sp. H39-3-26]|uniref:phosphonate C-P lyase system protein PhnG n=1 Tax=Curvibacter soli TaxID=3031331 RepID=UPI0023DC2A65|nr:phosphonate C-P lyase system protein PhnG [Ramlibacter sp. H39-3-26]MDF1484633.1 phosphonate C-P lyase system protein PhnG [Ramlibacter sp. H39-3-26]
MPHFTETPQTCTDAGRAQWMGLLARAPVDLLERGLSGHADVRATWLKAPQTGLMMVRARAGGSGEKFNLGEATVTRCVLRLVDCDGQPAVVGVAYVLGRSHRQAQLMAMADALLQLPAQRERLEASLLAPLRAHLDACRQRQQAQAESTRVDFLTVAREAASAAAGEPA